MPEITSTYVNGKNTCVVAKQHATNASDSSESENIRILKKRHFPFGVQIQIPWASWGGLYSNRHLPKRNQDQSKSKSLYLIINSTRNTPQQMLATPKMATESGKNMIHQFSMEQILKNGIKDDLFKPWSNEKWAWLRLILRYGHGRGTVEQDGLSNWEILKISQKSIWLRFRDFPFVTFSVKKMTMSQRERGREMQAGCWRIWRIITI